MADSSSTKRRRLTLIGSAAAALALSLSLAPGTAAAGPKHAPPGASHAAAPARTVDVMTRNLYLGADLGPVIAAIAASMADPDNTAKQQAVAVQASITWKAAVDTMPAERMAAIADEIAEARPAVVGLQEVSTWTTYDTFPPTTAGTVQYDFLELLLKALADRGVVYHEVESATADNFASDPIPLLPTSGAAAVSLADRDVIIKRAGVKTWNAHNGTFDNILEPPAVPLEVPRGWGSVDVRTKLATFRFVNSHLEAGFVGFDAELLRVAQVQELLEAQAEIAATTSDLPIVYVGDYNSRAPGGPAYQLLVDSVGSDAWLDTNLGDPGYTCCFNAEVDDPDAELYSRIDLVVIDDEVEAKRAYIVGEEPSDMTASGLWPSDHAGVVARLIIDKPSHVRERGHRGKHRDHWHR